MWSLEEQIPHTYPRKVIPDDDQGKGFDSAPGILPSIGDVAFSPGFAFTHMNWVLTIKQYDNQGCRHWYDSTIKKSKGKKDRKVRIGVPSRGKRGWRGVQGLKVLAVFYFLIWVLWL
jgi:hypothetical protein